MTPNHGGKEVLFNNYETRVPSRIRQIYSRSKGCWFNQYSTTSAATTTTTTTTTAITPTTTTTTTTTSTKLVFILFCFLVFKILLMKCRLYFI